MNKQNLLVELNASEQRTVNGGYFPGFGTIKDTIRLIILIIRSKGRPLA